MKPTLGLAARLQHVRWVELELVVGHDFGLATLLICQDGVLQGHDGVGGALRQGGFARQPLGLISGNDLKLLSE